MNFAANKFGFLDVNIKYIYLNSKREQIERKSKHAFSVSSCQPWKITPSWHSNLALYWVATIGQSLVAKAKRNKSCNDGRK